jgi:hypothetical protein
MILVRTTCAAMGYEKYVGLQHTLVRIYLLSGVLALENWQEISLF